MNEYERALRDCQLSIKTCQNLDSSLLAFSRLCQKINNEDHLIISSLFHMGIMKYAKPFLNNDSGNGKVSYQIKALKKEPGFSRVIHEHMIKIRQTLIAHDDFTEVMPKILYANVENSETDSRIPISIIISNKSISHPSDLSVSQGFKTHIAAALKGSEKNSKMISRT